jgi:hypothetical protein
LLCLAWSVFVLYSGNSSSRVSSARARASGWTAFFATVCGPLYSRATLRHHSAVSRLCSHPGGRGQVILESPVSLRSANTRLLSFLALLSCPAVARADAEHQQQFRRAMSLPIPRGDRTLFTDPATTYYGFSPCPFVAGLNKMCHVRFCCLQATNLSSTLMVSCASSLRRLPCSRR